MAFSVQATWTTSNTGMSMTLDENGVGTTTVQVTTTHLCHTAIPSTNTGQAYTAFSAALQSQLNGAGTLSYSVDLTVTADQAYYTVSVTSGAFKLTFTGSPGTHMRQVLGYAGDLGSYSSSHSSFWIPYYLLVPAYGGKDATATDDYEPEDIGEEEEADDGTAYNIVRTTAPTYNDWKFRAEPYAGTYKRQVTSTVQSGFGKPIQWTYQHFYEHVRGDTPFLVVDSGGETTVHQLRGDSVSFKPNRMTEGFNDYWSVPFKTRVMGERL